MADPYNYRPDIGGWSSDILPKYADWANDLPDGCKCVELGVYHGRSLLFLAEYLYGQGKYNAYLLGVDTWHEPMSWETWETNRKSIGPAANLIVSERMPSAGAARLLDDESVDLVFIDADHAYNSVKADIAAWWPKVKVGGIFAGHDYGAGVAQAVDEFARDNREQGNVGHFEAVWWMVKR